MHPMKLIQKDKRLSLPQNSCRILFLPFKRKATEILIKAEALEDLRLIRQLQLRQSQAYAPALYGDVLASLLYRHQPHQNLRLLCALQLCA